MPIRRLISTLLLYATLPAVAGESAQVDDTTATAPPTHEAAETIEFSEFDPVAVEAPAAVPIPGADAAVYAAAQQIQTGEYRDAELQLAASIAEIERQTTRYDRSLAQPLMLLGDALSGQGKYAEALPAYEQARHVIRVNDGLHTPAQVEIVYREANTLAAMGEIAKANARQEYAYETLFRNHPRYDDALVPGILHLAAWYERTFNIFAARGLYEYAALIVLRTHGESDPGLIPALKGLARTYREERFPVAQVPAEPDNSIEAVGPSGFPVNDRPITVNRFAEGERALVQIVRITQANPSAAPLDVALAELDLADWYLLFDNDERAITIYVHARQLMRLHAGLDEPQIDAYFKPPQALWLPIPGNPPAPDVRVNATQGHVEVSYTLTEHGECTDLKTIDSQPEGLMDTKVRRGLHFARFRPQFDGDVPVAATNRVYRHTFTYYPRPPAPLPSNQARGHTQQDPDQGKAEDPTNNGA